MIQGKKLVLDKSDWTPVKFGDVVQEPKESVKNATAAGIERVVGLEHIDSENVHLRRFAGIEESTTFTKKFSKGDVLFGRRRAYLKKAAQAEFEGICSGDITVMRAKDNLLPELLPFIVQNEKFFDYAIEHSAGGLSPRVKFKDLANYEFLLPPKEQQAKLAELLWAMDEVVEKESGVRDNLNISMKSVRKEHFTLSHPNKIKLGKVGKWLSGGTPSRKNKDYWNGDIPWVSPKDMKSEYITNSIEKITASAVEKGAKILPKNTILIVVRGLILAHSFPVALTKTPVSFNQDMKAIIVSEDFDPEYILSFLQYLKDRVVGLTTTTTHGTRRLATDTLTELMIPEPKETEKHAFLEKTGRIKKAHFDCISSLEHSKNLQKSLINQVF
ncbi:Type I restriction modification DNA specificity domain-containing protein [Candidatus Electrothrix aarhusensis]